MSKLTPMSKRKQQQVRELDEVVIRRILDNLLGPEAAPEPTPEMPLGGMVHLSGIGQIPVSVLRAELERRGNEAAA
jgi:hypothetical protein